MDEALAVDVLQRAAQGFRVDKKFVYAQRRAGNDIAQRRPVHPVFEQEGIVCGLEQAKIAYEIRMADLAQGAGLIFELLERVGIVGDFFWQYGEAEAPVMPRIPGAIQLAEGCERDEIIHAVLTEQCLTGQSGGHT